MKLSDRIRLIRKAHQLTQADVANRMNIATSTYGQIERNSSKATYETLLRVAQALGVSIIFLIDMDSKIFKP